MERGRRILVGVDGSSHSRKALEWAGDEAAEHGSDLTVVMAYLSPPPPPSGPTSSVSEHETTAPREAAGEAAEQLLMETIRNVLGDDPPVKVQPRVREGNASKVLIDLSEDAELLVVGTRGHGGFAGMLLGSVSQNVAAHARCTVVVVR